MSSAGGPKDLRRAFEKELLGQLWEGKVNAAIELLKGALEWVRNPGPPRHFFLSFLRFSIVTNYCTYRLYLFIITKATENIVKRCDDVPQKLRFSPNAGPAIRPSSPILMRWPW